MTAPGRVDPTLEDGAGVNAFLTVGAIVGAVGWLLTQYVAWNPGLGLETVGLEGTTVVVLFWLGCTLALVGGGLTVVARAVRYSPLMWIWGLLLVPAFALNAAVVGTDLIPKSMRRYALWHPWMVVYALGYLATGVVAVGRNRSAYLIASFGALALLLIGFSHSVEARSWVFALTAIVHAGPLLVDAATSSARGSTAVDSNGTEDSEVSTP